MEEAQWFCHVTTWKNIEAIMNQGLYGKRCVSKTYDGFLEKNDLKGVWFVVQKDIPTASRFPYKDFQVRTENPMVSLRVSKLQDMFHFEKDKYVFYKVNYFSQLKMIAIIRAGVYEGTDAEILDKRNNGFLNLIDEGQSVKYFIPADSDIWVSVFLYLPDGENLPLTRNEEPVWISVKHNYHKFSVLDKWSDEKLGESIWSSNNCEMGREKMEEAQWFCHVTSLKHIVSIMNKGLEGRECLSKEYNGFLEKNGNLKGIWFEVRKYMPTTSYFPFKDAKAYNPMVALRVSKLEEEFYFEDDNCVFYKVHDSSTVKIVAIIPDGVYEETDAVILNKQENGIFERKRKDELVQYFIPADSNILVSVFLYFPDGEKFLLTKSKEPVWTSVKKIELKAVVDKAGDDGMTELFKELGLE